MIKFPRLFAALFVFMGLSGSLALAQSVDSTSSAKAQAVIAGQINAFKAGNHDQAFSYAAPSIRKLFGSTDRFIGMVKGGYGAIYGAQSWKFERSRMAGDAVFQEVRLVGPNGREWLALYTLRQQPDGTWKIAGVQMKPGKGQTT